MNDLHNPAIPSPITPAATEGKPGGKKRAADRLNLPPSIVRAAGFVPGDSVYVVAEDPAAAAVRPILVLLKEQPAHSLGTYRVSADGRIRVTPAMLKKAGLDGEHFAMEGGSGKIVVRPQG